MARVHPEPEELFEIQCPDLTAEEELASYLPAYRHPVHMVTVLQNRWDRLHAIAQPAVLPEFLRLHSRLQPCSCCGVL